MTREDEQHARPAMTAEEFVAGCKRRFGMNNPERMREPVWEWMVRFGRNPFVARDHIGAPERMDCVPGNPDWCFERFGMACVSLPDGRQVYIAGEHEDHYDPDFCIYNDVIVRSDDDIAIYGYPREVFPPTGFHTATLVGSLIWIVGSLGYKDERTASACQLFALDTSDWRVTRVPAAGDDPGWIHEHKARLLDDGFTIEIAGGKIIRHHDGVEIESRNIDRYQLDTRVLTWTKVTDTSAWRQVRIAHDYDIDHDLKSDFMAPPPGYGLFTGDMLEDLGYPPQKAANDPDDSDLSPREHLLQVDDVRVRVIDAYRSLDLIAEGPLDDNVLETLITQLIEKIKASGLIPGEVTRH